MRDKATMRVEMMTMEGSWSSVLFPSYKLRVARDLAEQRHNRSCRLESPAVHSSF